MKLYTGQSVTLQIDLHTNNTNIRLDEKQYATSPIIPKGTKGTVKTIRPDEILVDLYWNPTGVAGTGNQELIWVKRYVYGTMFSS